MSAGKLSHFDAAGHAHMVDVSDKPETRRTARAEGLILMAPEVLEVILAGTAGKGDVLGVARLAGIMAAKRTADLIPLCHPLPLSKVALEFEPEAAPSAIRATAMVRTTGPTGVEMEALTAVSVALLTIYDMVKAMGKDMRIEGIRLLEKEGGKSGHYTAREAGA